MSEPLKPPYIEKIDRHGPMRRLDRRWRLHPRPHRRGVHQLRPALPLPLHPAERVLDRPRGRTTTSGSSSSIICWSSTGSWRKGMPYDKAIVEADRAERRERRRAGDLQQADPATARSCPTARTSTSGCGRSWRTASASGSSTAGWCAASSTSTSPPAATTTSTSSCRRTRSGSTTTSKRPSAATCCCTSCTSATAWPPAGPTARPTPNRAASNTTAAIIPTSCTTPWRPRAGPDRLFRDTPAVQRNRERTNPVGSGRPFVLDIARREGIVRNVRRRRIER